MRHVMERLEKYSDALTLLVDEIKSVRVMVVVVAAAAAVVVVVAMWW